MNTKKIITVLVILVPIVFMIVVLMKDREEKSLLKQEEERVDVSDTEVLPKYDASVMDGVEVLEEEPVIEYEYLGDLSDVTKGKTILSINTGGLSSGTAEAIFENNTYKLKAEFKNLPELSNGNFYEGWVVRKGLRFSVLSTGKAEKIDGVYINTFESGIDLRDHDFYVLTIEPNDGDPAPADHILEGKMVK